MGRERARHLYIQCILLFAPKSSNKDSASFTVGNPTMEMNHQPAVASNIHRKDGVISPSKDFLFTCCANPYTQTKWQFIDIVYDYYTYGKGHATWFLPSSYAQSHSMTLTSHFSSFAFTGKINKNTSPENEQLEPVSLSLPPVSVWYADIIIRSSNDWRNTSECGNFHTTSLPCNVCFL